MAENLITRPLRPSDAAQLRAIRLESFRFYGRLFTNHHKAHAKKPMTYWKEQARETTKHCFFGLFQYKRMVGVLAAEKSKHHRSVVFYGSYALPEYRGQSLMRPLYETREKWCKDHGYRKAELFIVKGNTRSREIFLKRGAKRTHTRSMRFSGGPKASWDWYKLAL